MGASTSQVAIGAVGADQPSIAARSGRSSESRCEATAEAAVTVSTAGHDPIFLASGWDSPKPST